MVLTAVVWSEGDFPDWEPLLCPTVGPAVLRIRVWVLRRDS